MSGAKPTTPEAIMAESDSKHDGDKRRTPRRGGAPWPPPGADTAWWAQDGGTDTAALPTSASPSERSAPDIPAPTTAADAADSAAAAEPASDVVPAPVDAAGAGVTPDNNGTGARTVRATRRRGSRQTKLPTDQPTRSRRPKSSDPVGRAAAVEPAVAPAVESAAPGGPVDIDSAGPANVEATDATTEASVVTEADAHVDVEPAGAEPATEPAGELAVDGLAVDELARAVELATDGDAPAGSEPVEYLDWAEAAEPKPPAESAESETPVEISAFTPIQSSGDESDIEDIEFADTDPDPMISDWPAAGEDTFSVAATIVADGDFVEEPEFAVLDMGAPPSTRRNAPDTGFPVRAAPPDRPPARREPVPAATAQPPSRQGRAPLPVQSVARTATLDNFWDGDRIPGVLAPVRRRQPIQTGRPHRHRKAPRRPAFGLPALLIFALAAAFFAWVSATPLLLTAGHGSRGVATVATCSVHGIGRSCAEFVAADKSFTAAVTLLGPAAAHASAGQKIDAQMVSRGSSLAYAGNNTDLLLHWVPGVVLLVLCGFGIAWATGALRLAVRRTRSLALLGSFGGPILLFAGLLAYSW